MRRRGRAPPRDPDGPRGKRGQPRSAATGGFREDGARTGRQPCPVPCLARARAPRAAAIAELSELQRSVRLKKTQCVLGVRMWRGHFSMSGEDLHQFCGTAR